MMTEKQKGSRRRPPTIKLPTATAAEVPRSTGPAALTQVVPGLFVSGYEATHDLSRLQTRGITHVLNLAGASHPPTHPEALIYHCLHIPDNPKVDILFFLYLAFEFITTAIDTGGCVLVQCAQGISRAPTVACAYLMWTSGLSQSEALQKVLSAHPDADPNLGFLSQLQGLQEEMHESVLNVYTYSDLHGVFMECRAECIPASVLLTRGDRAYYLIGTSCEEGEVRSGLKMLALLERFGKKAGATVNGVPVELTPVLSDLRISLR